MVRLAVVISLEGSSPLTPTAMIGQVRQGVKEMRSTKVAAHPLPGAQGQDNLTESEECESEQPEPGGWQLLGRSCGPGG